MARQMGAIFMKLGRAPDTIVIFIVVIGKKMSIQKYAFLGKLFVTLPIIFRVSVEICIIFFGFGYSDLILDTRSTCLIFNF
jgi:hypothetical protein